MCNVEIFARGAMSHPYIKLDPQVMFPTKISDSTKSVALLRGNESLSKKTIETDKIKLVSTKYVQNY